MQWRVQKKKPMTSSRPARAASNSSRNRPHRRGGTTNSTVVLAFMGASLVVAVDAEPCSNEELGEVVALVGLDAWPPGARLLVGGGSAAQVQAVPVPALGDQR